MSATEKLSVHDGTLLGPEDVKNYRSVVGALQYLSIPGLILRLQSTKLASILVLLRPCTGQQSSKF
jgi:hypothetical protein